MSKPDRKPQLLIALPDSEPAVSATTAVGLGLDGDGHIAIFFGGHGDKCSRRGEGAPVVIERRNHEIRVIVWSDINQEDPTHVISLNGARESARKGRRGPYRKQDFGAETREAARKILGESYSEKDYHPRKKGTRK